MDRAVAGGAIVSLPEEQQRTQSVKIAVVSNNGETISRHFGKARSYLVVTVENGEVVARELRSKASHEDFAGHQHGTPEPGQPRGYGHGSQAKHRAMTETIGDCDFLIAGGMGQGAFASLQAVGIETVMTDERDVSQAVERFIQGDLPNLTDRLH
jgi:predicted Fe-Mo cluster-binding NifX family protein